MVPPGAMTKAASASSVTATTDGIFVRQRGGAAERMGHFRLRELAARAAIAAPAWRKTKRLRRSALVKRKSRARAGFLVDQLQDPARAAPRGRPPDRVRRQQRAAACRRWRIRSGVRHQSGIARGRRRRAVRTPRRAWPRERADRFPRSACRRRSERGRRRRPAPRLCAAASSITSLASNARTQSSSG